MATSREITLTPPPPLILDLQISNQQTVWEKWRNKLEMYFVASNIKDTKQKRAILLYQGGEELEKIYKTLDNGNETYEDTVTLLNTHFNIEKNVTYERHRFRARAQETSESAVNYITALKDLASTCKFNEYSADEAIIDQFIEQCASQRLRRQL